LFNSQGDRPNGDLLQSISYYQQGKMARKLQILQQSLSKKEALFNLKLEEHFATLHNLKLSIKKTELPE
jgi:hypothetical protein